ncbi:polyphosphate kinase [Flavipsychrobacter stenotrophus]|uniref:Polyphosphate kinase n=1 Tax=Flavipsychrobacter stenotrophus TaxID=2077091 RepID=A0A2S7SWU9_9BACT|nr:PPK2 family polyphosphate kinase [Flavipsychrobacter stenotrophus]PQJ11087.1 polyphosphate kinase [Flavipsychrobacter stenotrophus]
MKKIKLKDIDTRAPKSLDKQETKEELAKILEGLDELQNLLYAEGKHSILVIIQGMDASGKDGLTRDVFTSMNPQGVNVYSFKEPTQHELAHDFLWRVHQNTPAKGMVQIFNRSHYEDVLVTRVHGMIDDKTARQRMQAINNFEQLLTEHNDTHILKFYLHISPEEQKKRLEERLSEPSKMWKYNANDFKEAKLWDNYMGYYEEIFDKCSDIPWHIIPADQNWYKSYLVAQKLEELLKSLKMKYPGMKK